MDNKVFLFASMSLLLTLVFVPSLSIATSTQAAQQPTMPPFDPLKAINCNVTAVSAEMANSSVLAQLKRMPAPSGIGDSQSSATNLVVPMDFTNHQAWGTWYYSKTTGGYQDVIGVEAMQYIEPGLTLPAGDLLYAPSFKGPDPMALEVSTEYSSDSNGQMTYTLGIYDWSGPGWSWGQSFNWLQSNHYTSTYQGVQYYNICIYKDNNNKWGMFLYRFSDGLWVEQWPAQGDHNVQNGNGQDYYEGFWNAGNWPNNVAYIESSNQEICYLTGVNPPHWTWSLAYNSLGLTDNSHWGDGTWTNQPHGWYGQYYDWYVGTHP